MNCRSRASRSECIIALRKKANASYTFSDSGQLIMVQPQKGSNPEQVRRPAIKCPICKKFLYYVWSTDVKNDTILFALDDSKYATLPLSGRRKCNRCHQMLGVILLDSQTRKRCGLPQQSELRRPLTIEEIYIAYNRVIDNAGRPPICEYGVLKST